MPSQDFKQLIESSPYFKWNLGLTRYFFNEDRAEQEVHLFVTREDIIKVGKKIDLQGADLEVYNNFFSAIREGPSGSQTERSILHQAIWSYELWKKPFFYREEDYPLYFNYLILFILALTESKNENLRHNSYYPELHSFLLKHNLPHFPSQNRNLNWNALWKDLESWSILDRNTEIGFFELHKFSNENWIYVGKPLSQCIFPIKAIKKLSTFFEKSGLVPKDDLGDKRTRQLVKIHGSRYLNISKNLITTIANPDDELGQSIVKLIKRKYLAWDGTSDTYDQESKFSKKGLTVAQLRLCFKYKAITGVLKPYFRLYSELDFPDDLCFEGDHKCYSHNVSWSKPIQNLPFKNGLKLIDPFNKWKALFPKKGVRIFIKGDHFNLNDWVEIPRLKYCSKIFLLVQNEFTDSVEEWGETLGENNFKRFPNFNSIKNHKLYEVKKPKNNHPSIEILQYPSQKKIIFKNGLKTGPRKWLFDPLPCVELENGTGEEKIYLEYSNKEEKVYLTKIDQDHLIWDLPTPIKYNYDFFIGIEDEKAPSDGNRYQIVRHQDIQKNLQGDDLPLRNLFGEIIHNTTETEQPYIWGHRTFNINKGKQIKYEHYFRPVSSKGQHNESQHPSYKSENDLLINFLTFRRTCTSERYFEAFETIYNNNFSGKEIEAHPIDLPRLKRWSLNYLDYMGHIDYEYSTKSIIINPPRLILVPASNGRKAVLIGSRTKDLVKELYKRTIETGLQFNIVEQNESTRCFLLPNNISVEGFSDKNAWEIEEKLTKLSKDCSIYFDLKNYPQCNIAELSGDITEYENIMEKDEAFDDYGWVAKGFDPNKLKFVQVPGHRLDKTCSLVEYKLNEYTYRHKFWKDGVAYSVNKNWGRYLVLKRFNKEVIFYDRDKQRLAVPVSVPLPRLLAESMTLCSGDAPFRQKLKLGNLETWFNLYKNIPSSFAHNKFQKIGQTMKEVRLP